MRTDHVRQVTRFSKLALGMLWAGALLWVGLTAWRKQAWAVFHLEQLLHGDPLTTSRLTRAASLAALASAEFVLMVFVADDLCPRAPWTLRAFGEMFAGVLAIGAMAVTGWELWMILAR